MEPLVPGSEIARQLKRLTAYWQRHGTIPVDWEDESVELQEFEAYVDGVAAKCEGMQQAGGIASIWTWVQVAREVIEYVRNNPDQLAALAAFYAFIKAQIDKLTGNGGGVV